MSPALRVALVHYHLRPGGVGSVMGHHQAAVLAQKGIQCVILAGSNPACMDSVSIVPELDYTGPRVSPATLARRIHSAARKALGGPPDIWHVHNHALGKNPVLTLAIHRMAQAGERLLLQIHDFAEDGRPSNYKHLLNSVSDGDPGRLAAILYPQAPNIEYAVLNRRDQSFLLQAGFDPERVHVLPNPIPDTPDSTLPPPPPPGPALFLYPTRALRRKNLGELLLWAATAGRDEVYGTTLAPTNPSDRHPYERWKHLAFRLRLPVQFELGASGTPLAHLVQKSRAVITTSIAEGFGLAFLEPWVLGRPLVGRSLPELTSEFEETGVRLSALYDHLWIPASWLGSGSLEQTVRSRLASFWEAYGRRIPPDAVERALDSMTRGKLVDFGRLDEPMQERIIRKLAGSSELRSHLRPHHPWLKYPSQADLAKNRDTIRQHYGLTRHGERLAAIYEPLLQSRAGTPAAPSHEKLLAAFLAPERFYLLRT